MIYKELKIAIINWLIENEKQFQRINSCIDEFRQYIYTSEGNFCINGENVYYFIKDADNLLYKEVEII